MRISDDHYQATSGDLPKAVHQKYSSSVIILRPKREAAETEPTWRTEAEQHTSGMRLVYNQKMVAMFNELSLRLKGDNPCTKAKFEILRTEKWGLAWKYTWKCLACSFKSGSSKRQRQVSQVRILQLLI